MNVKMLFFFSRASFSSSSSLIYKRFEWTKWSRAIVMSPGVLAAIFHAHAHLGVWFGRSIGRSAVCLLAWSQFSNRYLTEYLHISNVGHTKCQSHRKNFIVTAAVGAVTAVAYLKFDAFLYTHTHMFLYILFFLLLSFFVHILQINIFWCVLQMCSNKTHGFVRAMVRVSNAVAAAALLTDWLIFERGLFVRARKLVWLAFSCLICAILNGIHTLVDWFVHWNCNWDHKAKTLYTQFKKEKHFNIYLIDIYRIHRKQQKKSKYFEYIFFPFNL